MLNTPTKIALIILLVFSYFLNSTERTSADLYAEETVRNNSFKAVTLAFEVASTINRSKIPSLFSTYGLLPAGFDIKSIAIVKRGQMDSNYYLRYEKTETDDTLCKELTLTVLNTQWQKKYEGPLSSFTLTSRMTNTPEYFITYLGLDSSKNELQNKRCDFRIVARSFRTNQNETRGLFSKSTLVNTVYTGQW